MVLEVTPTISIHAPLTGSDLVVLFLLLCGLYFNPRSPYGERPGLNASRYRKYDFNPRSPYGERQKTTIKHNRREAFQSTLPLRGATLGRRFYFIMI